MHSNRGPYDEKMPTGRKDCVYSELLNEEESCLQATAEQATIKHHKEKEKENKVCFHYDLR